MDIESTNTLWWKRLENMEHQTTLYSGDGELLTRRVVPLEIKKNTLDKEKSNFLEVMSNFIDRIIKDPVYYFGRPQADLRDILKSLLVMSYHSMSYRRAKSDITYLQENELISKIPPRSTLNRYANQEDTKDLIGKLVQYSATFFIENDSTLILDSTWLSTRMYTGGYKKVHDKKNCNFEETRKLHLACMKNSKVIAFARATKGTVGDSTLFEEMVRGVCNNGFIVSRLLADAGYSSKNNYLVCKELGILNAFIDFRSNAVTHRAKSDLWRERVTMWKESKELWKETYRFRVIIEGIISAIKRKNLNWLRSKKETAQDTELLLKCLVYNLTIIGRYY